MFSEKRLNGDEIKIATTVFGSVLPFERIYLTDINLGGAVTLAGINVFNGKFDYKINWPKGFVEIASIPDHRATLIHELTHVWQGENGLWPTVYIGQSIWAQLSHGIGDIVKQREWKGWDTHRSTAYYFSASAIGRDWWTFNAEQQASLVESWYMPENERVTRIDSNHLQIHNNFGAGVYGGGCSVHDARFPYIRDVIRACNRKAKYIPLALPYGADRRIKAMQDKLVALGYLDAHRADGYVGRSQSATLDALEKFQRRNGLRPDRDFGGPNSETQRKLALPASQLVRQ